ncbi:Cell division control 48-E-like protein [Hordeum vulgare]|nr:Cell division control 48-E-like protein [Hordeum vulgare]
MYQDPLILFTKAPPAIPTANWKHIEDGVANEESFVQQPFMAHGGGDSDVVLNTGGGMHDGDDHDDISSQPLVPYVGMEFDSVKDAYKFYNDYAFRMGFGSRIDASKYARRKVHNNLSRGSSNVCTLAKWRIYVRIVVLGKELR